MNFLYGLRNKLILKSPLLQTYFIANKQILDYYKLPIVKKCVHYWCYSYFYFTLKNFIIDVNYDIKQIKSKNVESKDFNYIKGTGKHDFTFAIKHIIYRNSFMNYNLHNGFVGIGLVFFPYMLLPAFAVESFNLYSWYSVFSNKNK